MKATVLDNEINTLRNTLAWMDQVMATLNDGVFVVNSAWEIVFVNNTFADLVSNARVLLLGKSVHEVLPLTQKRTPWQAKIEDGKLNIKNCAKLQGIYNLTTGKTSRILELHCTYIPKLRQAVCVVTDITFETRALQRLHKLSRP